MEFTKDIITSWSIQTLVVWEPIPVTNECWQRINGKTNLEQNFIKIMDKETYELPLVSVYNPLNFILRGQILTKSFHFIFLNVFESLLRKGKAPIKNWMNKLRMNFLRFWMYSHQCSSWCSEIVQMCNVSFYSIILRKCISRPQFNLQLGLMIVVHNLFSSLNIFQLSLSDTFGH